MCILPHTQNFGTSPECNHRGVKLIATLQMLPTHPAPSPPQQPRGSGLSSVLRTPHFGSWRCLSSYPAWLNSASLIDPVLQALLQGSNKSWVMLSWRRLDAEFTSSQRDLCNPRVQGVSRPLTEGGETRFPDESRSWELCMFVLRGNRLGVGDGIKSGCSFFVWSSNNIKDCPHRGFMICGPLHFSLLSAPHNWRLLLLEYGRDHQGLENLWVLVPMEEAVMVIYIKPPCNTLYPATL